MAKKEFKRAFEYHELLDDIPCSTSSTHILTIFNTLPRGDIFIVVRDYLTYNALGGIEYTLEGNETDFSGSTDKYGIIYHEDIPAGHYLLTIKEIQHLIPTIEPSTCPHHLLIAAQDKTDKDTPIMDDNEDHSIEYYELDFDNDSDSLDSEDNDFNDTDDEYDEEDIYEGSLDEAPEDDEEIEEISIDDLEENEEGY